MLLLPQQRKEKCSHFQTRTSHNEESDQNLDPLNTSQYSNSRFAVFKILEAQLKATGSSKVRIEHIPELSPPPR